MKILLGYDGSNAAMDALKLAVKHGKAFNGTVYVIHSLTGGAEDNEEKISAANDQLDFAEGLFKKKGCPVKRICWSAGCPRVRISSGSPRSKRSRRSSWGSGAGRRWGSCCSAPRAAFVILNAPCPVITIR